MALANSEALVGLLPHRPPFRFVDAVDALDAEAGSVKARYRVTGDEAFLAGHFPGNPIFPGVIQVEALAQTGAVLLLSRPEYAGKLPLFGGAEAIRWKRMVVPGDELTMTLTAERLSARGGWAAGEVRVGDELSCRARIMFAFA
ncbi:MAG: 3-hydroxyacyl-ACP dehydratase FabZ [Acidimicrobiia bacterium]